MTIKKKVSRKVGFFCWSNMYMCKYNEYTRKYFLYKFRNYLIIFQKKIANIFENSKQLFGKSECFYVRNHN